MVIRHGTEKNPHPSENLLRTSRPVHLLEAEFAHETLCSLRFASQVSDPGMILPVMGNLYNRLAPKKCHLKPPNKQGLMMRDY